MNLTLSIDEALIRRAREAARLQGKSVNQMVREYLQQLTSASELDAVVEEFRRSSGQGRRSGWSFKRDELHERT